MEIVNKVINYDIIYLFNLDNIVKKEKSTCSFSIPERTASYSSSLMSEMNLNLEVFSRLLET